MGEDPRPSAGSMPEYSYEKAGELLAKLRRVDAMANARPALFFTGYERIGGYPVFVEKALGPYLWDVDGNKYIDLLLGFGSVVLGHADPAVSAAVTRAVAGGVNPTLLSLSHLELAEKLVSLIPCAELVTFLKTGSDAVDAAVRLARAVTGKKHILYWGHHGWHDWCARESAGVLPEIKAHAQTIRYNDIDYAEHVFAQLAGTVAAVVLMPYEIEHPQPNFLARLKDLAHRNGALFVLDEIRSGFRIAMGGAQERFGVVPDLATFSKAISNGHALSVLAGRRQYMERILELGLTVTYYRSPDGFAAALATIKELEARDGPARLQSLGKKLMAGLDSAAAEAGVPAKTIGFPSTPFIGFEYRTAARCQMAMRLFCNGMLRRGVLLTPEHHWFLCVSMEEKDIDHTIHAASETFRDMRAKI